VNQPHHPDLFDLAAPRHVGQDWLERLPAPDGCEHCGRPTQGLTLCDDCLDRSAAHLGALDSPE
jgi:hypothetical protein